MAVYLNDVYVVGSFSFEFSFYPRHYSIQGYDYFYSFGGGHEYFEVVAVNKHSRVCDWKGKWH